MVSPLDVPDHPGITFFATWAAIDKDGSGVAKYQVLSAISSACDGAAVDINNPTVSKMAFVNNRNTPFFCIRAVDRVGNLGEWVSVAVGASVSDTFYHTFEDVTTIERRDTNNPEDLTYTIADHLGSAALTVRADGSVVSTIRYLPYVSRTKYGSSPLYVKRDRS